MGIVAAMAGDFSLVWGVPFAGLVLTIALMPLVAPALWQRHYGALALFWAVSFVLPDMAVRGWHVAAATLVDTGLNEYVPFVALLGTLYVVTGGLRISGAPRGTPEVNTGMLGLGVLLGGAIGTPGAALLMLRPLIRANRHRQRTTHIFVFFIILVANVGGALSPIGNAPLFLGYLRGVPFFWPSVHLALPTLTLSAGLLATFYALEHYLRRGHGEGVHAIEEIEKLGVEGGINLVLLAAAIVAIMPRVVFAGSAAIVVLGARWPVVDAASDVLLLAIAAASCLLTAPAVRRANDFAWAPLIEVGVLFAALFVTLIPLTAMMAAGDAGPMKALFEHAFAGGVPHNALFYRATGIFSAILDNAPTYLVFFGLAGNDAARLVGQFPHTLAALSAGACYFGGLTYLGNAPNLMVRAIAERHGVRMPSFFGYMVWAAVCLVPWLLLVEAIFFE
jgi:Na+/H+ antiporter NhaD/arsenite permease-like protein